LKALPKAQAQKALEFVGLGGSRVSEGWQPASGTGGQASVSIVRLTKSLTHGKTFVVVVENDTVGIARLAKSASSAARAAESISAYISEVEAPKRTKVARSSVLSAKEKALLAEGGLDVSEPIEATAVHATAELFKTLQKTSLTVERAARKLGVNESRIRQRLLAHRASLYGMKRGRTWLLPGFQFDADGLVPGIETAIAQVPRSAHPVSVYRWFTSPHQDLYLDAAESEPITPLDWLKTGSDPKKVAELARELGDHSL